MPIRWSLIVWLLASFVSYLPAQCSGNLGENIFTDGDFGAGPVNIPATNPGIAPGYNYTTTPPPNDGSYVITNNTTTWGSFASLWDDIGDNSSDPNGYMMVVNASFTPGLFYEQVVDGLCENTLYVFSADIYNLIPGAMYIKPNVSFLIDGNIAFETGDIPDNSSWITYGFTFTTAPGQTSVTLALANNAPGGNGNDLALDNITFRPCGPEAQILPETVANICEDGEPIILNATVNGDQYDTPVVQWQESVDGGISWNDLPGEDQLSYAFTGLAAGEYYFRYLLANAPGNLANPRCRVVSNVKVVNVIPKFYTIIDTLCEGLTFNLNGVDYGESGIYVDSLLTTLGCDSVVTLELTIVPDPGISPELTTIDPSCKDFTDGAIQLDTIINGVTPYSFLVGDDLSLSGDVSDLGAGRYTYSIEDRYGCRYDTLLELIDPIEFVVEIGQDQFLELGENTRVSALTSAPYDTLIWRWADSLSCLNDCASVELLPVSSGVLTVLAQSAGIGCPATDSLLITVIDARKVYLPNAFSPNGDGVNDAFTVFAATPNVQRIENLRVFDRWGGLVFERTDFAPNDPDAGWDGNNHEGKPLPTGIFLYQASIRFLDGRIIDYAGEVSLVR